MAAWSIRCQVLDVQRGMKALSGSNERAKEGSFIQRGRRLLSETRERIRSRGRSTRQKTSLRKIWQLMAASWAIGLPAIAYVVCRSVTVLRSQHESLYTPDVSRFSFWSDSCISVLMLCALVFMVSYAWIPTRPPFVCFTLQQRASHVCEAERLRYPQTRPRRMAAIEMPQAPLDDTEVKLEIPSVQLPPGPTRPASRSCWSTQSCEFRAHLSSIVQHMHSQLPLPSGYAGTRATRRANTLPFGHGYQAYRKPRDD
ncbi:MAG: hypothetical protein MHM6MM_008316 [Cercozoa sp. M6MM]